MSGPLEIMSNCHLEMTLHDLCRSILALLYLLLKACLDMRNSASAGNMSLKAQRTRLGASG